MLWEAVFVHHSLISMENFVDDEKLCSFLWIMKLLLQIYRSCYIKCDTYFIYNFHSDIYSINFVSICTFVFLQSESPPPPPITQPVSRLRETVDPLRGLEETPQRTFKRKRVDPPVTSLISSNTTTTATVSPSPQILTDSSSSFDLSEIKKPKDEPIDYESDIEEIECKVISTDNSIAQLLQGETSQPLQESPQSKY